MTYVSINITKITQYIINVITNKNITKWNENNTLTEIKLFQASCMFLAPDVIGSQYMR